MRVAIAMVVVCGCFHPSPPAGIPCNANGDCPGEQICDMRLSPPTCVDSLTSGDGGIGDDTSIDDDATVDAPPPGACVEDTDCDAGICHELAGTCVPDAEVLFVAPSGAGMECTRVAPCGTLQAAIDARTQTRYTIALAPGAYSTSFDTSATLGAVNNLVVSGPTRTPDGAVITSSEMNRVHPQLTAIFEGLTIRGGDDSYDGINSRGTTTLARVRIDVAAADGVVCAEGTTTILDSHITASRMAGVHANGGTLTIERTQISGSGTWGIHVDGAAYTIVNSIIASNGAAFSQSGGVRLRPGNSAAAAAVFRFNTLARNTGLSYPSITCDTPANISNVIVGEQSLIFPVITPACSATYSLFNTSGMPPMGTGNITGNPMFTSMTDFHLQMGSPALGKANPNGAVAIDIDGQQRGAPPDIGADERP